MGACMQCDLTHLEFQLYEYTGFFGKACKMFACVVGLCLYVAVCLEAWVTATYYHFAGASWAGFLLALLLFNGFIGEWWWRGQVVCPGFELAEANGDVYVCESFPSAAKE